MLAKNDVARERLAHLIRSDAPLKEIEIAARTAGAIGLALEKSLQARPGLGKWKFPSMPTVFTTEEHKIMSQYRSSRDLPARDIDRSGRLISHQRIAEVELLDARHKAEAFESRRHLWKFQVEGWDKRLSLKDVEQALKEKKIEKLNILNFIRPSKRATIKSHIEYLGEVKSDIQKQLAKRGEAIERRLMAAELRHDIATEQVEQARAKWRCSQSVQMGRDANRSRH